MAYETTNVPVDRSQGGIRRLLQKHGADRFAFGQDVVGEQTFALVRFVHEGNEVRLRVPLKEPAAEAVRRKAKSSKKGVGVAHDALMEQEERRIWRVVHYLLKSRMEAVEEDVETFVQAFLAHVVNPSSGRTVYEELVESGTVELPAPIGAPALPAGSSAGTPGR